ncbi:MAG: hypothetical protein IKO94_07125 [Selenomonadaceae bacterium]|nr:hypothetical protein [Selenomonadaceae bacterium]
MRFIYAMPELLTQKFYGGQSILGSLVHSLDDLQQPISLNWIAHRIRQLCREQGITPNKLSKISDVPPSHYQEAV